MPLAVFFGGLGDGGKGAGEDGGNLGEDGHNGGGGDAAGQDFAPGLQGEEALKVADDADNQAQDEAQGHGVPHKAQFLLKGIGVRLYLVEAQLIQQVIHGHGVGGAGDGMQRRDGAGGVAVVAGPPGGDKLGAKQGVKL